MVGPRICCCVLCGAVCGHQDDSDDWRNQFRAVYDLVEAQPREAQLSGPVRCRPSGYEIEAKSETEESQIMGIDLMPSEAALDNKNPAKGFPIHKSCWEILNDCWSPSDQELQLLLGVFRSVAMQGGTHGNPPVILNWGHDYGGLYELVTDRDTLEPGKDCGIRRLNCAFSSYNPVGLDFGLIDVLKEVLPDGDTTNASTEITETSGELDTGGKRVIPNHSVRDVFHKLPVEIRQQVLENLPLSDALALRQASRTFAELGFHDLFWKSRFYPDGELGHMLEVEPFLSLFPGHWRSVWLVAAPCADRPWIENRARVTTLVSSLRSLVHKAGSAECSGNEISNAPKETKVWWQSANRSSREHFLQRYLPIPSKITAVYASTVDICGRECVAGIRIQHKDRKGGSRTLTLGYQHPDNEILLLNNGLRPFGIAGFCLAIADHTIRGLSLIADTGTVSRWAGVHDKLLKRRLIGTSSGKDTIKGLRGTFDAFKLVSLGVTSGIPRRRGQTWDEPAPKDSMVWYSDLPDHHLKMPELRYAEDYNYPPHNRTLPMKMMLFGGAHGQDLPFVTRIIVQQGRGSDNHSGDLTPQLWAIKIRFPDGREPLYFGDKVTDPFSVSFPIDGPGGERITAFRSVGNTVDWRLGFKIRTNRGRTIIFPFGMQDVYRGSMETEAFDQMDETVVGIFGKFGSGWGISVIGAICL